MAQAKFCLTAPALRPRRASSTRYDHRRTPAGCKMLDTGGSDTRDSFGTDRNGGFVHGDSMMVDAPFRGRSITTLSSRFFSTNLPKRSATSAATGVESRPLIDKVRGFAFRWRESHRTVTWGPAPSAATATCRYCNSKRVDQEATRASPPNPKLLVFRDGSTNQNG
jgi:hypothetical protein